MEFGRRYFETRYKESRKIMRKFIEKIRRLIQAKKRAFKSKISSAPKIESCVKTRMSCRSFHKIDVPFSYIYNIVSLSLNYPSAGNIQNTHIICVRKKDVISKIAELSSNQLWISQAPFVLVVIRDDTKICDLYPEKGEKYSVQSTASCIENILLMTNAYNLGTCWVGEFEEEEIKKLLEIDENLFVDAIIPIGYPKREEEKQIKDDTFSKIYFERFGNKKRI